MHNTAEGAKNTVCSKVEGAVDHRGLEKFFSGCKNLNDQARSGRPKTLDSEAVHQNHRGKSDKLHSESIR